MEKITLIDFSINYLYIIYYLGKRYKNLMYNLRINKYKKCARRDLNPGFQDT